MKRKYKTPAQLKPGDIGELSTGGIFLLLSVQPFDMHENISAVTKVPVSYYDKSVFEDKWFKLSCLHNNKIQHEIRAHDEKVGIIIDAL